MTSRRRIASLGSTLFGAGALLLAALIATQTLSTWVATEVMWPGANSSEDGASEGAIVMTLILAMEAAGVAILWRSRDALTRFCIHRATKTQEAFGAVVMGAIAAPVALRQWAHLGALPLWSWATKQMNSPGDWASIQFTSTLIAGLSATAAFLATPYLARILLRERPRRKTLPTN